MSAIENRYKTWKLFQHVLLSLIACLVASPLHPLLFQATEEAFNHGIIPTIPFTTHAAFKAMGFELLPKDFAGILRTTIRVMGQTRCWPAPPDGHLHNIAHELCFHAGAHAPAHHFARTQVNDYRQI